jgi:hypothetical protein
LTRISSSVLQTHLASQPGTTSPHANDFTKAPYIRRRTAPPYCAARWNPAIFAHRPPGVSGGFRGVVWLHDQDWLHRHPCR